MQKSIKKKKKMCRLRVLINRVYTEGTVFMRPAVTEMLSFFLLSVHFTCFLTVIKIFSLFFVN